MPVMQAAMRKPNVSAAAKWQRLQDAPVQHNTVASMRHSQVAAPAMLCRSGAITMHIPRTDNKVGLCSGTITSRIADLQPQFRTAMYV